MKKQLLKLAFAASIATAMPAAATGFSPITTPFGLCMHPSGGFSDNGTSLLQWDCNTGDYQDFEFRPSPFHDGFYRIVGKRSGKCLDVPNLNKEVGAEVALWDCRDDSLTQLFKPVFGEWDTFSLVNAYSELCVDVYTGTADVGNKVVQWNCHGGLNQSFASSSFKKPADGTILSNLNEPVVDASYGWNAGATFTQEFTAQTAGFPAEIGIDLGSGNYYAPYFTRLVLERNGVEVFDRTYLDVTRDRNSHLSVFSLKGIKDAFRAGDKIRMRITPGHSLAYHSIKSDNPNWPRFDSQGYGMLALRFYMRGAANPDLSSYPEKQSPYLRHNLGWGSSNNYVMPMPAGHAFTQSFSILQAGVPHELCLRMHGTVVPYDAKLILKLNGQLIFEKDYRISQNPNMNDHGLTGGCTNFDISSLVRTFDVGEIVTFTVQPSSETNINYVSSDIVGITKGPLPRYGDQMIGFYLK